MSTDPERVTLGSGSCDSKWSDTLGFATAGLCGSTLAVTGAHCGIGPVYKLGTKE